jgi:molybdate transport system regulatory protein
MSMKTTARNQFAGTVSSVDVGPVSAEVSIALKSGGEVTATMTAAAAKRLKLKKGKEAIALIKASAVVLVSDFAGWQLSARNQLAGTVSRIERGAVSSLVVLTLPGGANITASVTNEGVEALALKVGTPATAVFKAYAVMVAAQPQKWHRADGVVGDPQVRITGGPSQHVPSAVRRPPSGCP